MIPIAAAHIRAFAHQIGSCVAMHVLVLESDMKT